VGPTESAARLPAAPSSRFCARPLQVALQDGAAALVATFDVSGRGQALHPADKFDVARRVAGALLAQAAVPGAAAGGPAFQKVLPASCLPRHWRAEAR
jgi:hypothetical protein